MRKLLPAFLVVALVAGCGGGKKTPQMTKEEYVAALNKLCTSGNRQVAALKLSTSIETWKQNGQRAAKIARQTVTGFEALTPPDSLRKAAEEHNQASRELVKAVQDAADAAKSGDTAKFDDALSRQQNFGLQANAAATEIGANACA
jgi:cell division GTPase FtsZ